MLTERQIKHLSKIELLDIILQLQFKLKAMEEENAHLKEKIDMSKFDNENAGSIADAVVSMSGIFELAQKTADDYVQYVKQYQDKLKTETETILKEAEEKAKLKIDETNEQCKQIRIKNDYEINRKWREYSKNPQKKPHFNKPKSAITKE